MADHSLGSSLQINKDGIRKKTYLGREIAKYLFEATTDNPPFKSGCHGHVLQGSPLSSADLKSSK